MIVPARRASPSETESQMRGLVLAVLGSILFTACGQRRRDAAPVALAGRRPDRRCAQGRHDDDRLRRHRPGRRWRPRSSDRRSSRPESGRRTTSRSRTMRGRSPMPRLIVSNGVGLDDFLDRAAQLRRRRATATRLVLGDGMPTIDVDGEPNPHFWLDPTLVADGLPAEDRAALSAARTRRQGHLRGERRGVRGAAGRSRRRAEGAGRDDPRREPEARDVPRRLPVLRQALRLRARRRHRRQRRPGAERIRAGRARREGQGSRA